MNETGFLGRFLPDFGRIVAMMQFDMYHSYTVDEHTVFALGILNGIETGRLSEIAPIASAAIHELICVMNYMWRYCSMISPKAEAVIIQS